ncbi:MAG TPA: BON domain-containing protein [Dehalococcoidia bacterium]|nr:BON domain-containing protein [Dehalococcoidia bacterium]
MEKKTAPLRLGSRVRFRDRWEGRLSGLEVDDEWIVLNVLVRRGVLRSRSVKLPFSAATEWSAEAVSFDCTAGQAFRREVPPVAAAARPLSARTAVSGTRARLVGALVERKERRLTHLLFRLAIPPFGERWASLDEVALDGGRLELTVQPRALRLYRSDEELQGLVREALAEHPYLTPDDRRSLTVEVADGRVRLGGNIRSPQAKKRAAEAAATVAGVVGVDNEIVDDGVLELAVARALLEAEPLLGAAVYVRSSLGAVTLSGYAPSAEALEEVVRLASRVWGVREVHNRLEVRPATAPLAAS